MAHGLADILAYQAVRIGGTARRTETAQTTVVAECGKYDARILACETSSQSARRGAPLSAGRWAS